MVSIFIGMVMVLNFSLERESFTVSTQQPILVPEIPSPLQSKPSFTGAIIVGITRPVTILGKEGFSPSQITIKEGDSITWTNSDTTLAVLTFQRGREQNQFFNSPVILPHEEWEYVFWEEGEYNYWSTTRGVEGKIVVEPCRNKFCPEKK